MTYNNKKILLELLHILIMQHCLILKQGKVFYPLLLFLYHRSLNLFMKLILEIILISLHPFCTVTLNRASPCRGGGKGWIPPAGGEGGGVNYVFLSLCYFLKGVFAKNERGYWLNAIKKRFWSLLILLLSFAFIRRKLLKTSHTE